MTIMSPGAAGTVQDEVAGGEPGRYFLPGERLVVRPGWRRPGARPLYARVRGHAPGRLHFNVFDFSRMRPELPGGGGLGTSTTTARSEVVVTAGATPPDGAAEIPTARHLVRLFAELAGYPAEELHVSVPERIAHVHSGFGSNVTFNTAVVAGLNALFGSPLSVGEMWDLLTLNFVENADAERLYWGLETGVGESCLLYGGLVWVDEHCRFVGSIPTDGLWVVTATGIVEKLASPMVLALEQAAAQGVGDTAEADLVAVEAQRYQREHGAALRRFLDRSLRPALLRGDLRGLLSLGWELNRVGTFRLLERMYRADVLNELVDTARRAGALYANLSSAGPSFFAFAESEARAQELRGALEARFGGYFGTFATGRAGTRLTVEVEGEGE